MSKGLEYVIMLFLFLLIVLLYGLSENGRYQVNIGTGGAILIDTRSGNHWLLHSKEMISPPAKKR